MSTGRRNLQIGVAAGVLLVLVFAVWVFVLRPMDAGNDQARISEPMDTATDDMPKQLAVTVWNVAMDMPAGTSQYRVIPQDDFAVWVSNEELDAYLNNGTDCEVKGVQIAKIPTEFATDSARVYSASIGGYKYGIAPGFPNFGICNDDRLLQYEFDDVQEALIEVLPSLHAQ